MRFKKIYVEITNVCNLSCEFCIGTSRKKGFVSLSNFEKILEEIKPFTGLICLHVLGEPLLHPSFDAIVKLCEIYKMQINLVTNGTLISSVSPDSAFKKVSFSLHSFPFEKYGAAADEAIRQYLNDIYLFSDAFKGITEYRLWNGAGEGKSNEAILTSLSEKYRRTVLGVSAKIADRVYLSAEEAFEWPSVNNKESSGQYCHALSSHAAILTDGSVVPCCLDSEGTLVLGNIYKSSFSDILSSDRAKAILNGFRERKPSEELCRKCSYIERFNI